MDDWKDVGRQDCQPLHYIFFINDSGKLWRTSATAAGGGAYRNLNMSSTGRAGNDGWDESMTGAIERDE